MCVVLRVLKSASANNSSVFSCIIQDYEAHVCVFAIRIVSNLQPYYVEMKIRITIMSY